MSSEKKKLFNKQFIESLKNIYCIMLHSYVLYFIICVVSIYMWNISGSGHCPTLKRVAQLTYSCYIFRFVLFSPVGSLLWLLIAFIYYLAHNILFFSRHVCFGFSLHFAILLFIYFFFSK